MSILRRWDEWNQRSITRPRPYYRVVPSPTGDRYYEIEARRFVPAPRVVVPGIEIIGIVLLVTVSLLVYILRHLRGEAVEVKVRSARTGDPVHLHNVGTMKAARTLIDEWEAAIRDRGPDGLAATNANEFVAIGPADRADEL